ncbi:hypothetical protein Tco_0103727 [Tanacetum coccineum]
MAKFQDGEEIVLYTMTDVDVNAPTELAPTMAPPTRTDDQILPHIRWVLIGKSICYLDVDRPQSNPIFKILITPVNKNNAFSSPPTPDALIKFVNDLGYPKVVRHLSDVVTNDMFQPWRALTTIINFCLTRKTSGFERPRALVLQIFWGVINRAHIDYAERMWEEFTQSIHTFIEDKKNLAQHTQGKKKATLIVIPSIRFTKLIIYYLQSKHKFHARPGSPLHLPNEEPVLGYLKFSSKGTKREVFGMPIPNDLVTDDIQGKQYYNAYMEKVAKHQRYLAGEDVSDPDSPAPKPTKGAKPKTTKKPTSTQQTKPKTKHSIAKTIKVSNKKTLQLRDKFIDEVVPVTEPKVDDEEAIVQKVLEESMKDAYLSHRGPLPPVVFREPDSGKLQPLPEVQGKGKEMVGEEQAAQVLLNLQTPKKKNPAEQFIFQRRTCLTDSGTKSDEEVSPKMSAQGQEEGQGGTNPGDAGMSQTPSSHVVHAGPNLDHMDLGIVEASSQPNTEQMDDEFTAPLIPRFRRTLNSHLKDTSSVPLMTTPVIDITDPQSDSTTVPASMPTTTTTVTETITTTTVPPPPPQPQQDVSTSILIQMISHPKQNIADLVEANQALEERLDKQGNMIYQLEKSVKEVVIASVQHATRAPLRARFKDLPTSDMKEILLQRMLEENYDKSHEDHKMAYKALQKSIIRDESEKFDADKAEERTKKKSKHDSPKTSPGSPPLPPPPPPPSGASGASSTTRASDSAQDPPPSPPSSTANRGDKSQSSAAPGSSKTTASTEYTAWITTTSRLKPAVSSVPEDVLMHEESDFEAQDMGSDDEDNGSRHIPKVSLNQEWFKPLSKKERHATPEPAWSIPSSSLPVPNNNWASVLASSFVPLPENSLLSQTGNIGVFIDWFCKKQGITELTPEHLEGPAYEVVKAFHPDMIHLQFQMEECHKLMTNQVDEGLLRYNVSRPLSLGGPPGQGDKLALSITKMKAASYPDAGLEQMVPNQMWSEEEYMYDISASYGISHWWFKRQQFYIDRHSADTNRRAIVRTHMRILSVVRIEVFSLYVYDYMKKIVLRRADNQEYTIVESDFKDLYPSDFEDLYLLNLQGHLNHLPPKDKKILSTAVNLWIRNLVIRKWVEDFQLGIESYQTQLNLTKPRWEATGLEFIHDYKILDSPRAVVFRDKYGMQMIMLFNEIHKFSDGTLQQIDEALDYWIKEFKVNKKRLKLRRIFWNLESFVGGRIREGDYRLLQRTE